MQLRLLVIALCAAMLGLALPGNACGDKGGGGHGRGHAAAGSRQHPATPKGSKPSGRKYAAPRPAETPDADGSSGPWSVQRSNEQRKLTQRLATADHLEQVSRQNGNEHLRDAAERMRERAQEHYEKRTAKIAEQETGHAEETEREPPRDTQLRQPIASRNGWERDRLTGLENARQRQLNAAERQLQQRLDAAQTLYDLSSQQSDPQLQEVAARLEQQALQHYDDRLDAIYDFSQRHGLPEPAAPGDAVGNP